MTPDQMRKRILDGSRTKLPDEGSWTLWLAMSDDGLQEGSGVTDHVMKTGLTLKKDDLRQPYVDLMMLQHHAHILGASAIGINEEGRGGLFVDVVSANRRTMDFVEIPTPLDGELRRSTTGVFEDDDISRYQEIIRRNVMENEGAA